MYFAQTVSLKVKQTSLNNYGEFSYANAVPIKARKQPKEMEVVDTEGHIHKSTFEVYTHDTVHIDDMIDDRLVISVQGLISLGGQIKMYVSLTQ